MNLRRSILDSRSVDYSRIQAPFLTVADITGCTATDIRSVSEASGLLAYTSGSCIAVCETQNSTISDRHFELLKPSLVIPLDRVVDKLAFSESGDMLVAACNSHPKPEVVIINIKRSLTRRLTFVLSARFSPVVLTMIAHISFSSETLVVASDSHVLLYSEKRPSEWTKIHSALLSRPFKTLSVNQDLAILAVGQGSVKIFGKSEISVTNLPNESWVGCGWIQSNLFLLTAASGLVCLASPEGVIRSFQIEEKIHSAFIRQCGCFAVALSQGVGRLYGRNFQVLRQESPHAPEDAADCVGCLMIGGCGCGGSTAGSEDRPLFNSHSSFGCSSYPNFAAIYADGSVILWKQSSHQFIFGASRKFRSLSAADDTVLVLTDDSLTLWRGGEQSGSRSFENRQPTACTAHGIFFAVGFRDGGVALVDRGGQDVRFSQPGSAGANNPVTALTSNGSFLASATRDRTISIFDDRLRLISRLPGTTHSAIVTGLSLIGARKEQSIENNSFYFLTVISTGADKQLVVTQIDLHEHASSGRVSHVVKRHSRTSRWGSVAGNFILTADRLVYKISASDGTLKEVMRLQGGVSSSSEFRSSIHAGLAPKIFPELLASPRESLGQCFVHVYGNLYFASFSDRTIMLIDLGKRTILEKRFIGDTIVAAAPVSENKIACACGSGVIVYWSVNENYRSGMLASRPLRSTVLRSMENRKLQEREEGVFLKPPSDSPAKSPIVRDERLVTVREARDKIEERIRRVQQTPSEMSNWGSSDDDKVEILSGIEKEYGKGAKIKRSARGSKEGDVAEKFPASPETFQKRFDNVSLRPSEPGLMTASINSLFSAEGNPPALFRPAGNWSRVSKVGRHLEGPTVVRRESAAEAENQATHFETPNAETAYDKLPSSLLPSILSVATESLEAVRAARNALDPSSLSAEEMHAMEKLRVNAEDVAAMLRAVLYQPHPKLSES